MNVCDLHIHCGHPQFSNSTGFENNYNILAKKDYNSRQSTSIMFLRSGIGMPKNKIDRWNFGERCSKFFFQSEEL